MLSVKVGLPAVSLIESFLYLGTECYTFTSGAFSLRRFRPNYVRDDHSYNGLEESLFFTLAVYSTAMAILRIFLFETIHLQLAVNISRIYGLPSTLIFMICIRPVS